MISQIFSSSFCTSCNSIPLDWYTRRFPSGGGWIREILQHWESNQFSTSSSACNGIAVSGRAGYMAPEHHPKQLTFQFLQPCNGIAVHYTSPTKVAAWCQTHTYIIVAQHFYNKRPLRRDAHAGWQGARSLGRSRQPMCRQHLSSTCGARACRRQQPPSCCSRPHRASPPRA